MTDADLARQARDEAERRYPTEMAATEGFIAGAEWAVSELPIPADDDAPCPRCGCPTACPEGRMEALSAELAEVTAERDALARRLDTMRAVLADHPDPTCRVHPDNDPVQCGWKRAYTTLRDLLIQP
jgi:hypothetical protein